MAAGYPESTVFKHGFFRVAIGLDQETRLQTG
jgi:hypothetical protein